MCIWLCNCQKMSLCQIGPWLIVKTILLVPLQHMRRQLHFISEITLAWMTDCLDHLQANCEAIDRVTGQPNPIQSLRHPE